MSSIIRIIFEQRNDGEEIAAKIAASVPMEISIENVYAELSESSLSVNGLDPDTLAALLKLADACTFTYEDGGFVFVIEGDGKGFDLTGSYVRDAEDTSGAKTAVPDGTPLLARFEIPGFGENEYREIPLYYNEDFDPADLLLLEEIGITVSGNGASFTIANATDCRAGFSKPDGAPERYIIDYSQDNETIKP